MHIEFPYLTIMIVGISRRTGKVGMLNVGCWMLKREKRKEDEEEEDV